MPYALTRLASLGPPSPRETEDRCAWHRTPNPAYNPPMTEPADRRAAAAAGPVPPPAGPDSTLAMERYIEVLRSDPQNADALYYVAVVACQEGQYQQGIELARRAIEFGPPQARVHNLLGQALHRLGEPLEAIKNFDQAHRARRRISPTRTATAPISWSMPACPSEALQSFDRALALNPTSAADWLNRGALLQTARPPRRGAAELRQAPSLCAPDLPEAHFNRANALAGIGRARGGRRRLSTGRSRWRRISARRSSTAAAPCAGSGGSTRRSPASTARSNPTPTSPRRTGRAPPCLRRSAGPKRRAQALERAAGRRANAACTRRSERFAASRVVRAWPAPVAILRLHKTDREGLYCRAGDGANAPD